MNCALVTGGTGFIGRHAVSALRDQGFEVHAAARTPPEDDDMTPGVIWHAVDLLDAKRARSVLEEVRPTHLLHLAWYAVPGAFWTSVENVDWAAASLNLLRAFAELGGQHAVVAGSCAEYRSGPGPCIEDITPLDPATLYGECKLVVERVGLAAAQQLGISLAAGRIFFLYGPAEHPSRLVSSVVRSLLQGEGAACSHGEQVRDFLHAADVASALVHLLNAGASGAFNVGSGRGVKVRSLVELIAARIGRPELIDFGGREAPADEPTLLVANIDRLGQLGWEPRITLEAGLDETIDWWRRRTRRPLSRSVWPLHEKS